MQTGAGKTEASKPTESETSLVTIASYSYHMAYSETFILAKSLFH